MENFQIIAQSFVDAVPFGALLALIAVGYTMVYGIIQLVNFAHGEIFMFAAYFLFTLLMPLDPDSASHSLWNVASSAVVGLTWVFMFRAFLPKKITGQMRNVIAVPAGVLIGVGMSFVFPCQVPFLLAYGIAIILTAAMGVTIDRIAYRPLRNAPRLTALITAIGVSFFLLNLAQTIWEARTRTLPEESFPAMTVSGYFAGPRPLGNDFIEAHILQNAEQYGIESADDIRASHRREARSATEADMGRWELMRQTGRIQVTSWLETNVRDVMIVIICLMCMLALRLLVMQTKMGRAMRACSMDKTTAQLVGIDVDHVVGVTFVVGSALAAVAAPLYILKGNTVQPTMGYIVGLMAFASAVLGGIGNIPGALLGGFMIGIITSMAPAHMILEWPEWMPNWFTEFDPTKWSYGIAYFVLILVIVVKPTGLLGKASATRA